MTAQRVAIYDASHSVYDISSVANPVKKEDDMTVDTPNAETAGVFLQPIPDFQSIVLQCVQQAIRSGIVPPGTIAPVNIGVVCGTNSVKALIRSIHTMVSKKLEGS